MQGRMSHPRMLYAVTLMAIVGLLAGCSSSSATPVPATAPPAATTPAATTKPATAPPPASVAAPTAAATTAASAPAATTVAPSAEASAPGGTAAPSAAATTPPVTPQPTPTACGTGPTGSATVITFWSWVPGICDQVTAFNASQSAIYVDYENNHGSGNGEYANLNTAIAAGTGIPDVVQIEFQHLGSYIATSSLVDLSQYGANDVTSKFVPWTIAQVSQGSAVYAYPQDAGPMIQMCNTDLLKQAGMTDAPKTWADFEKAVTDFHTKLPNAYFTNFTADQGWYFGLLWQAGAVPFKVDGTNITINFTSPQVTQVATAWDTMIASGGLAPVDTYSSEWQTAIGNGTIACWQAGAWGPEVIQPAAPNLSGKWTAYLMPQWDASTPINGNYGGSTVAVTKASQHPQEAATFNAWLNTDPASTIPLANGTAGLFPVTNDTLTNPEWSDYTSDFFGGQKLHQLTAQAAQTVGQDWQWPPFTAQVYSDYADQLTKVKAGTETMVQAMSNMQTLETAYATDQGFTVTGP
jgi:multiple sugar transport system substrate-binding protein